MYIHRPQRLFLMRFALLFAGRHTAAMLALSAVMAIRRCIVGALLGLSPSSLLVAAELVPAAFTRSTAGRATTNGYQSVCTRLVGLPSRGVVDPRGAAVSSAFLAIQLRHWRDRSVGRQSNFLRRKRTKTSSATIFGTRD